MLSLALVAATLVAMVAGSALPSAKIVGGQFAENYQFPHQIALFKKDSFRCGGSIIDSKWILTAAHCVLNSFSVPIPADDFTVYAGSVSLREGGNFFNVEATFPHEQYGDSKNDIALIKLAEEIVFDQRMNKIELFDGELKNGTLVTISGFGRTATTESASEQLKYNTMYAQVDELCDMILNTTGQGLICLNNEAGNGACMGDSGGPAVYDDKLVGVANFVLNACGTVYPDGYAKVAFYRDWIAQVMKQ